MKIRLLAAVCTAALVPLAAPAAEVKLKAASFLPVRSIVVKPFVRFVEEANRRCDGKVEISIVGPEAVPSLEQWNAVKNGVVDLHYGPANYWRGVVPAGDVISLARNESAEQRANGAWALINEAYEKKLNAHYLTHLFNGVRFHLYTTKPAKDGKFEGMRLRSVPIYDAFFKSLGAQPVRMAPPDVYTALERNAVEGYGWPLWGISDFGWDKYTKYRHDPGFISAAVAVIVNLDRWKGLAAAQRDCLTTMAVWVEGEWPKWRAEEDAAQKARQEKAGVKAVDMGADFALRAEEIYWQDLAKGDPAFVKRIRPLLGGK